MKTILTILFICSVNLYSQVAQEWVRFHNGTGNGNDAGYTMELDASGNVYTAGTSYSTGGTGFDYVILKYDQAGNLLWTRFYNHTANDTDIATSMTIDGSGNVYVTGRSKGSGTGYDIATVKYNSAGVLQWTQRYNNSAVNLNDYPKKIKIDNSGNLYIAGQSYGTNYDCITIKLNTATGDTTWVRRYTGYPSNDDYATDLAIDNLGNPCVSATVLIGASNMTYLLFKYNTSGVLQFYDNLGTESLAGGITCDNIGNIYVGGGNRVSCCYRFVIRKYNSSGTLQWFYDDMGMGQGLPIVTGLVCDDSNNVIVCGINSYENYSFACKMNTFGVLRWYLSLGQALFNSISKGDSGSVYITGGINSNGGDYLTNKYNLNGAQQWSRTYNQGGSVFDRAYALKVGNGGDVYVTGESSGDIATIRYSQYLPSVPLLFSPVYNAVNQPITLNLVWYKSTAVANYRVQLATDSLFNTLVVNDSTLTDSIRAVTGLNYLTTYWWRVNARNAIGTSSYSQVWRFTTMDPVGIQPIGSEIPSVFKLYANYPNPFNPSTVIHFDIPKQSFAKLVVYDLLGREAATLVNEELHAGRYEVTFDGSKLASGMYFYKIVATDYTETKKMVLIK